MGGRAQTPDTEPRAADEDALAARQCHAGIMRKAPRRYSIPAKPLLPRATSRTPPVCLALQLIKIPKRETPKPRTQNPVSVKQPERT